MSSGNNDENRPPPPPPGGNDDGGTTDDDGGSLSLPAMAAARAALAHAGGLGGLGGGGTAGGGAAAAASNVVASRGGGRGPSSSPRGSPTSLGPAGSGIVANRSASPPTANANAAAIAAAVASSAPAPIPLALRGRTRGDGAENDDDDDDDDNVMGRWPLPAYCNFVPGGIGYEPASLVAAANANANANAGEEAASSRAVLLSRYCSSPDAAANNANGNASSSGMALSPKVGPTTTTRPSPRARRGGGGVGGGMNLSVDTGAGLASPVAGGGGAGGGGGGGPEVIIRRALAADATLRKHALLFAGADSARGKKGGANAKPTTTTPGHRLPSLSHLADAALVNTLTAVPAESAAAWAEAMVLEYMDGRLEQLLEDEDLRRSRDELLMVDDDDDDEKRGGAKGGRKGDREGPKIAAIDPATGHPLPPDPASSVEAADLLGRAVLSAWAREEEATGRTPTNSSAKAAAAARGTPLSGALAMPHPGLGGLLREVYRAQRGEDVLPSSGPVDGRGGRAAGRGCCADDASSPCAYVGGPCGYVFRRGDIAWNCRTCQTDATCVLCDSCFRASDHEGHEVFFHRTTPGGCCDCGDLEAWNAGGMCPRHRPPARATPGEGGEDGDGGEEEEVGVGVGKDDDFEAARAAGRARLEHARHVDGAPDRAPGAKGELRPLPPRLAAALAVVVGAAIQSVLAAAEGSAVGADISQWRLRWADDICRLWNGCAEDEEYYRRAAALRALVGASSGGEDGGGGSSGKMIPKEELWAHPRHVLDPDSREGRRSSPLRELPGNLGLVLRLHNDDVHTFDEVIKALHDVSPEPLVAAVLPAVGDEGSAGKVGGAGVTGARLRALHGGGHASAAPAGQAAGSGGGGGRPSDDMDISPRNPRRRRPDGASSPTWNRSPAASPPRAGLPAPPLPDADVEEVDPSVPLVPRREAAQELTRRVDAEGQVLVRSYDALDDAATGFARLRSSAGLHCSVSSSARTASEDRARALLEWLAGLVGTHPAVGAMVVQALVDVTEGEDVLCHKEKKGDEDEKNAIAGMSRGVAVWSTPRMVPCWSGTDAAWWTDCDGVPAWRRRMDAFPPHLESSYLTRREGRELFRRGILLEEGLGHEGFVRATGADPDFYADVPYSLPDSRMRKSPHALWGTLPSSHLSRTASEVDAVEWSAHPLLRRLAAGGGPPAAAGDNDVGAVRLQPRVIVLDTDLRKHEEGESLTSSLRPHRMTGLGMVSGTAHIDEHGSPGSHYFSRGSVAEGVTTREHARLVAGCSSFAVPASPVLLLLLLDPYSPKLLRGGLHRLFLSLLTDSRFKSRFAASIGAAAYRPTSTLFCAGIGTEADTLLGFTVQLFTTGSLVRALGNLDATRALLCREDGGAEETEARCVSALPIAHSVVRSIHANVLGATREVSTVVQSGADGESGVELAANDRTRSAGSMSTSGRSAVPPALVYQFGSEHPLSTRLPGAPDDKFIDSRCMKHKRLPLLLRDLEYICETPGTAVRLLRSGRGFPLGSPSASPTNTNNMGSLPAAAGAAAADALNDSVTPSPSFTSPAGTISNSLATYNIPNALDFPAVWARLLRLGQGIDLQKRRISGGHVEFEDERWLGAFGLSLNLSQTGDSVSEGPFSGFNYNASVDDMINSRVANREAMGSLFSALFREIKMWLYREGLLETASSRPSSRETGEQEALQRSTLHISRSQLDESSVNQIAAATGVQVAQSCDAACERGVRNLPEAKLALLEAAILHERTRLSRGAGGLGSDARPSHGPVMGDWLKVPHSPLAGDCFSFHLPLHRALARGVLSLCSTVVPSEDRLANPDKWWRLPLLDDDDDFASDPASDAGIVFKQDTLSAIVRSTHRSSNLRVVWSSGPECSGPEAQLRRSRSRMLSALLASTKVVHSLCDHPLRCIAAAQQIDHHMWAKNGGSASGMAMNYGNVPLCRSLRDLDMALVQLSAAGFNVGLGARRVFALLTNRFSMDGYLCDPDRRNSFGRVGWAKPPRMQEPEHAELLAESFFTTLCVVVSDLPAPPPSAQGDDSALRRNLRRELLHALAVEPRSHSEAMNAAQYAVSRRDEADAGAAGSGDGRASSFRAIATQILQEIGQQRGQGSRASGPRTFELRPEGSHEYDPSFYHLRRADHQHAMDNVARLRSQKLGAMSKSKGAASIMVLPLVARPPLAHPRFVSARLLLHLPATYAAIRRYLMYVLFNGSWLPPGKPEPEDMNITISGSGEVAAVANPGGPAAYRRTTSSVSNRSSVSASTNNNTSLPPPFSPETVAASSKSFLEVLHILTLQVHTLEECANLHRSLRFLDHEQRALSCGIDIGSYLRQLVTVPDSLDNVWALQCAPDGPLPSKGSGANRGSVLGLLVSLYEHRDNAKDAGAGQKSAGDDHGGARALSADGLKWLLRFVGAIADGAENVAVACESATSGIPVEIDPFNTRGPVHAEMRNLVRGMLADLPELWPGKEAQSSSDAGSAASEKSKEAQKAAQARAMARMKKLQSSFAASISSKFDNNSGKVPVADAAQNEENLCIICKCDDGDGDNGPMGYLGHVQRSRVAQLTSKALLREAVGGSAEGLDLENIYRVVGDKGCQLRSTESMESAPVAFLKRGSIVEVLQSKISPQLGLLSRRVLVRQVLPESQSETEESVQGWASIQSWQGYVILSPLSSLCYTNTRWGPTRPILRQCGHAAHLRCVEAHCLSLHQRAAGNQPYDGRFSANIEDGEFLCPLCKQLSNIVIPEEGHIEGSDGAASFPQEALSSSASASMREDNEGFELSISSPADISPIRNILVRRAPVSYSESPPKGDKATRQFGSSLSQAMQLSLDNASSLKRKEREFWHPALRRWDFEDDDQGDGPSLHKSQRIGSVLRLMRQQLVSWAAVGHSAAAAEAAGRGARQEVFGEVMYSSMDPWSDYSSKVNDTHPMLLELRRTLTATASLFDVLTYEAGKQLGTDEEKATGESVSIFGSLISDILEGQHWMVNSSNSTTANDWRVVTSIVAAMMCHLSKDDTVAPSLEARAVAAAMWTITGSTPTLSANSSGSMSLDSSPEVEVSEVAGNMGHQDVAGISHDRAENDLHTPQPRPVLPSKPLCIYRVERNLAVELGTKWGTSDPFKIDSNSPLKSPFRPAVASAFLYVPLLAWDLNILAGAVFSSLLSNARSNPCVSCCELLQTAKVLLIGRLIQVLSTPGGFLTNTTCKDDEYDDFDEEEYWDDAKKTKEATAIKELLLFCRKTLSGTVETRVQGLDDASLFQNVGNAILPFGRTLILLLRSSTSAVRQRNRRNTKSGRCGETPADRVVSKMADDPHKMTIDNGFWLLDAIGAPLPSSILKIDSSHSSWSSLVMRWLTALAGFESYHGTRGTGSVFSEDTKGWTPVSRGNVQTDETNTGHTPSLQNLHVETSAAAVEVEHRPPQGEQEHDDDLSSRMSNEDEVMDIVDEALAAESEEELENVDIMDIDFDGADSDFDDFGAVASNMTQEEPDFDVDDASDRDAVLSEPDGSKVPGPNDRMFSYVSRSAIIPYQPSLLGSQVGPGPRGARGEMFDYNVANRVMKDLSHLGSVHLPGGPLTCLVKLPKSFVELYSMVNRVKGLDSRSDDTDDDGGFETAICLLTGAVMRSGTIRQRVKQNRPPGTCTLHARKVGSGIGIFFLVQKCTILLMHNNKSAYSPSLYVDEHGEEDVGLRRGRPLFFSEERYQTLETLWRTHGIPREVSQIRSTSDRVIRDNWY